MTANRTTIWISGQILTASALNTEFNNLLNAPAITNTDIASGAAIAPSKINATFPASGLLVGTTDTQILTNKTLTAPTITGGTISAPTFTATIQTVTAMAAVAVNGALGNVFTRTLATSETFTQSGFSVGQCFIIEVTQGTSTTYTVTWFSTITWITPLGTAPVQTVTSNGVTTYGFRCTGSNTFEGYLVGTQ